MAQETVIILHNLTTSAKFGQVFKTMNLYMDNHDEELKASITDVLKMFESTNDLEKLVKIRLIDRYRCYEEVLTILKSEDLLCITHALQCSWFFENSNFDPYFFVDCVLPFMSYSTRMKVLKKYSKLLKNSLVAVTFFDKLKQRYGLNTALILLPACDEGFVKITLETINIHVTISVLLSLFQVYPSIVISYLTHLLEKASMKKRISRKLMIYSYEKLFILIAAKEPLKFSILMEKYHMLIPNLKLGKRSAKQVVHVAYDSIKKNAHIYDRIFNWKFIVNCLSLEQISELQLSFFPKTVNEFFRSNQFCNFVNITSSLKESVRREMLVSNFFKAYNKPISEFLEAMTLDLVNNLPTEIKTKWVESKLPELDNPEEKAHYIVHLPSKKSLPMLKTLIEGQTNVNVRSEIVSCMFKTAIINNDMALISDICQFVVKRLRNDRCIIRGEVVSELNKSKHLIEISDGCWELIQEIINIMILNDELNMYSHEIIEITSNQIHSRLKRNLPIDTLLDKLLKIITPYYSFDLCKNTPYEKHCLKWFLDHFPEDKVVNVKENTNRKENTILLQAIIKRLCHWNGCHKNDRIDLPDWLHQWIEELSNTKEYIHCKSLILEAIKKDKSLKHDIYSKFFPNYIDPRVLVYNLHQNPEFVMNYATDVINTVINRNVKIYRSFFKQSKFYPALNLSDIISNHCVKILKDNDKQIDFKAKINSILVLSIILPTNKFVEIIADFYPKRSLMVDYSDEGIELFQIQTEISSCLKYVDSPSEILEALNEFVVGDYLKLVIGSLNSVCLHIPEYKILPILKEWLDYPTSLRKHIFRAYFRIAPVFNTKEVLINIFENEKNISLRTLLFEQSLKWFINGPSSETFQVLKALIENLQMSDEKAINKLFEIKNVPNEFISDYLQLLWDVVSPKNETLLNEKRRSVINFIEPNILWWVKEEFCDVLIEEVFAQTSINSKNFVSHYLLYSTSIEQLNRRIEKVNSGLEQLLKKWNDFDLKANNVFNIRSTVSFFIDSLVRESFTLCEKSLPSQDILKKVKNNLLKSLKENEIIEEILLLDISGFFLVSPNNSELMYNFSQFIEPLVNSMVISYGNAIIDVICSAITNILSWKYLQGVNDTVEKNMVLLAENLIKSTSNHCFILGLKILPTFITSDTHRYRDLFNIILKNSDPAAKLFASKLFKKCISSVKFE